MFVIVCFGEAGCPIYQGCNKAFGFVESQSVIHASALEGMMKTVSIWIACLGAFVLLDYSFSFWTAFGVIYFLGILLVIIVAFICRGRHQPNFESESVKE